MLDVGPGAGQISASINLGGLLMGGRLLGAWAAGAVSIDLLSAVGAFRP